jgi:hypothetical protein
MFCSSSSMSLYMGPLARLCALGFASIIPCICTNTDPPPLHAFSLPCCVCSFMQPHCPCRAVLSLCRYVVVPFHCNATRRVAVRLCHFVVPFCHCVVSWSCHFVVLLFRGLVVSWLCYFIVVLFLIVLFHYCLVLCLCYFVFVLFRVYWPLLTLSVIQCCRCGKGRGRRGGRKCSRCS